MDQNKTETKRILLVDDNDVFRGALKLCLEDSGYEVVVAENGRVAQEIVGVGNFKAVVSDIRMTPVNGIELLQFIKKTSAIPVILMTGFSDLLETKEAFSLGAEGFLSKPFKSEELLKQLEAIMSPPHPEKEASLDDEYCRLSIDDFVSGQEIRFDIYIRLSSTKFIKVAHQGENIPLDRIKQYKEKGIQFLHMTRGDFKKYLGFNLLLGAEVVRSRTINKAKKLQFLKHTQDIIQEQLQAKAIDPELFEQARGVLENTVSILTDSEDYLTLLSVLNSHADFLYAHSLGVSLYGVLIAKEMGWTTPSTLSKVAMGGLLHDIGKKEIDRELLLKPRMSLGADEIKQLETHPERGARILSGNTSLPTDVLQIVLQHHEGGNGIGFPAKLNKGKIHPLARLISVANEFSNLVMKGPDGPGMSPAEGVRRLIAIQGGRLDPSFLSALGRLFGVENPAELAKKDAA